MIAAAVIVTLIYLIGFWIIRRRRRRTTLETVQIYGATDTGFRSPYRTPNRFHNKRGF